MVVRKRKRKNRLLGQRTRGNGDTKNRRGAGSRGGRGLAGSHKHKYSKYFGKFGKEKKKLRSKKVVRAFNIDQLVQAMPRLLLRGKVFEENGMIVVDGQKAGIDKLLGNGKLNEKIVVRNMNASKKAVEKIEKAGGRFEESLPNEEKEEAEDNKEKAGETVAEKPSEEKAEERKEETAEAEVENLEKEKGKEEKVEKEKGKEEKNRGEK